MQFQIRYIEQDQTGRIFIGIRPEFLFLSEGETALDVLLEALASMQRYSITFREIHGALTTISQRGQQHERHIVLPGAVAFCSVTQPYSDPDLPEICIDLDNETIAAPGLEKTDLRAFLGVPVDRVFHQRSHPEVPSLNNSENASDRYRQSQYEAQSIVMGLLSPVTPGPYAPYASSCLQMCGALIGLSKRAFCNDISGSVRGGSRALSDAHRELLDKALVLSDRGWMPRKTLRSGYFASCEADSDSGLFALGKSLSQSMAHLDPGTAHRALLEVLHRLGEDPVQYNIRDRFRKPLSNHELLKVEDVITKICDTLNIPTPRESEIHVR